MPLGRGHCTLCTWPSAAAPRHTLAPPIRLLIPSHPKMGVTPALALPRSRFVTGSPSLFNPPGSPPLTLSPPLRARISAPWMPASGEARGQPHRALTPPATPAGPRRPRPPGEATTTVSHCLGPALTALPLALRWTGRGIAQRSRGAGSHSFLPPPREIYLRNDLKSKMSLKTLIAIVIQKRRRNRQDETNARRDGWRGENWRDWQNP